MPNWDSVLREIASEKNESAFDRVRRKYLKALHEKSERNIVAYYSGFLTKPQVDGIQISDDDKNGLMLCFHKLNKELGLDLILHTPGGDVAATESIVDYIKSIFDNNVRAIVPQLSMSAGTMIACSCKAIIMGKHSSLGPVDPQVMGVPALGVLEEINQAWREIQADQRASLLWSPRLSRLTPSFVQQCKWAVERSEEFVARVLKENMFSDLPSRNKATKIKQVVSRLTDLHINKGHNKHFSIKDCKDMGLNVIDLEQDNKTQDIVLTVHHCFMHTLSNTSAFKIIENHLGRAMVRQQLFTVQPSP